MKKIYFSFVFFPLFFLFSCVPKNHLANLPPEQKSQKSVQNDEDNISSSADVKAPPVKDKPSNPTANVVPSSDVSTDISLVNVSTLTATVNGVATSQLSFRIDGYVQQIFAKNGQYLKKGQVVAILDNTIKEQQLKLAQYALEQAHFNQHYAELAFKRTQTLNKRQATTQIALEQSEAAFNAANVAVKTAEANLKLAEINFNETKLVAPFDGYLFNLSSWVGNYVSSNTNIATMSSLDNLQIQIPVPQTMVNNFSIGQEFSFSNTSQNIGGTLKITGVVPYVDANSKTYLLFATPIKTHGQLMAGELVVVDLK